MSEPKRAAEAATFRALLCEQRGCRERDYARVVLREALYPHARWVVPLFRWIPPHGFAEDELFLEDLGRANRQASAVDCVLVFASHNDQCRNPLRKYLYLRLSGARAMCLVRRVYGEVRGEGLSAGPRSSTESGLTRFENR